MAIETATELIPFDLDEMEILFRQITDPVPWGSDPGSNWYVEAHCDRGFPVGLVVVNTHPEFRPIVVHVFVVDDMRRRGIGITLIEACRERWPDIQLTGAISEAGEGLLKAWDR